MMGRVLIAGAVMMAMGWMGQAEPPVHALILSGQNNHDWRSTTPVLQEALEGTGRFTVTVTEAPETLTPADLDGVDVIVSNWNAWGEAAVTDWRADFREAFLAFVRNEGKGFVSVHAGSSSFFDWEEYHDLAITTWDLDRMGHGAVHAFPVRATETEHPITADMPAFVTHDELWHDVPLHDEAEILALAYSSEEHGGTGRDEPILFARRYGTGRSVNLLLGHDAAAMAVPAFQALFARSAEWAATGDVTVGWPETGWEKASGEVAFRWNGAEVWRFRFGPEENKPYFDPVSIGGGPNLVWNAPPDHSWHHGIWFSWKYLNGVNYWEEEPDTGRPAGRTQVVDHEITTQDDGAADIRLALEYAYEGDVVLREDRRIAVSAPETDGAYHIDWDALFTPVGGPVELDRTPIEGEPGGARGGGYAGLSVRLQNMANPQMIHPDGAAAMEEEFFDFDATAAAYNGAFGGRPYGIAIVPCPDVFDGPTPWYGISVPAIPFYYFSPAYLFRGPQTLEPDETLRLRYRIAVRPGYWDAERLRDLENTMKSDGDGPSPGE